MEKNFYFKNLDGLRFLAFFSVFVSHICIFLGYESQEVHFLFLEKYFLQSGDLGVNFFFVLSGFLITTLLFKEKSSFGRIGIKNFYMRRILRIWPLYFLVIDLGVFIMPFLTNALVHWPFATVLPPAMLWWYIFFAANIHMSFFAHPSAIIAVLWSISVEEQFYLIWPYIVNLAKRKTFIYVSSFLAIVSFVFRIFVAENESLFDFFTISVMSGLAIGALLAHILSFQSIQEKIRRMPRAMIALFYILLIILIPLKLFTFYLPSELWYRDILYAAFSLIFSVMFAFIIAEQEFSTRSLWKVGNSKLLAYLGQRSYGLYCFHMIAIALVLYGASRFGFALQNKSATVFMIESIVAFAVTCLLAIASFSLLERPFLSLRSYFSPSNE